MKPLEIFDMILDWILDWRFNLCFWVGVILAIAAANLLREPLNWILVVGALAGGIVSGLRWDSR